MTSWLYPMSNDFILETRDLIKEFKGFVAVNGVNLKAEAMLGTIVTIHRPASVPAITPIEMRGKPIHSRRHPRSRERLGKIKTVLAATSTTNAQAAAVRVASPDCSSPA